MRKFSDTSRVEITDEGGGCCYLYELSLLPALPGLKCEGSVAVQRTGGLHPHLGLGVDTLGWPGVRHAGPAGGQQDEDCVEVGPALGGGVEHGAALTSLTLRLTEINTRVNLRYPVLYIADNLTASALCIK